MDDPKMLELEQRFGADFIEKLGEDVTEGYLDQKWFSELEEGEHGHVFISDVQNVDAINQIITGYFWAGGVEHAFEAESGNRNGFVWRDVSADGPIKDIEIHHTKWALAPRPDIVSDAIQKGAGKFLLEKWDAFLTRPEVADIPGKYAYDRHFQPSSKVETYWRDKADEVGFVIVSDEEVVLVRKRIEDSVKPGLDAAIEADLEVSP